MCQGDLLGTVSAIWIWAQSAQPREMMPEETIVREGLLILGSLPTSPEVVPQNSTLSLAPGNNDTVLDTHKLTQYTLSKV